MKKVSKSRFHAKASIAIDAILAICSIACMIIIIVACIKEVGNKEIFMSAVSLFIALMSLSLSRRLQKELSFNNIFNTQIGLLRNYFNAECLQYTKMLKDINDKSKLTIVTNEEKESVEIDPHLPVYKNFCRYFIENIKEIGESELNPHQICAIWNKYSSNLLYRSEFEYSFKYIYMCIRTINESRLPYYERSKYINIVTDLINTDQLFCYYINQIANSGGDCENNEYVKVLRENNFFRDLFYSNTFNTVRPTIPRTMQKWFELK